MLASLSCAAGTHREHEDAEETEAVMDSLKADHSHRFEQDAF